MEGGVVCGGSLWTSSLWRSFAGAMAASFELWEVAISLLVGQSGLGGVW